MADDAWRLTFAVTGKHLHGTLDENEKEGETVPQGCAIQVDIQKVTCGEDTIRAVEFTKTSGSQWAFIQRYQEIKGLLSEINNAEVPQF